MKTAAVVLILAALGGMAAATEKPNRNQPATTLSNDNELLLPANYQSWVALAPTATGMPTHHLDHVVSKVYVEPASYERFLKHGSWPNHTVIVLELRDKEGLAKTPCDGVIGLEVATKDVTRTPDPWSYYGIIYDHHKNEAKAAEEKSVCQDCGAPPVDMRLAMYFPALRAVIHATPRTMQPSEF